jgi:hypothetical protein
MVLPYIGMRFIVQPQNEKGAFFIQKQRLIIEKVRVAL